MLMSINMLITICAALTTQISFFGPPSHRLGYLFSLISLGSRSQSRQSPLIRNSNDAEHLVRLVPQTFYRVSSGVMAFQVDPGEAETGKPE